MKWVSYIFNPCKSCGKEFAIGGHIYDCDACYWEWFKNWDGTLQ